MEQIIHQNLLHGRYFTHSDLDLKKCDKYRIAGIVGDHYHVRRTRDRSIYVCRIDDVIKCFTNGSLLFV